MRAVLAVLLMLLGICAQAQVPSTCAQYQATVTREVQRQISPAAPVAVFAAQIQQESSCNAVAKSYVGAQGLTQFMPTTAQWIATLDSSLMPANPLDPTWAIQAQVTYMHWLLKRNPGVTACDAYAFALSSYNGGEGWLRRDQQVAKASGKNPRIWFGHVEVTPDRRRNAAAIKENRGYPQRILLLLTPRYVAAGWGAGVTCAKGG